MVNRAGGVRRHRREAGKQARQRMGEASNQVVSYVAGKDEGIRASMRSGDVLLFRGCGLLSSLIRRATRSDYSHAGMLFRQGGRLYCLEAVGSGVRLAPVSRLLAHYPEGVYYCGVDAPEPAREIALEFGFEQLSLRYDVLGLVRFAFALFFAAKRRAVESDQRWFCSELVAAAYRAAGFPLTDALPCYTSPADLINGQRIALHGRLTLTDK
jgi:uncharacterized protein YycO